MPLTSNTHAREAGGARRPLPRTTGRKPDIPSLLTRRDLAGLLRISTRSLDRHRAAGEILASLPGPGQPRWDPLEVAAWIAAGRPRAEAWQRVRRSHR